MADVRHLGFSNFEKFSHLTVITLGFYTKFTATYLTACWR